MIGTIAAGRRASFLLGVAAVGRMATASCEVAGSLVTSEDGAFGYTWIPGGAVEITQGTRERARGETTRTLSEETERVRAERGLNAGKPVLIAGSELKGQGAMLDVEWSYQLDPLSSVFILIVTGVGLVHLIFARVHAR